MGSQVIAKCECGFETKIMIGGGMANFMTTCYFPCLCYNCQNVVQVNLLAASPVCPDCGAGNPIPYDTIELMETTGESIIAQWNVEESLGRELILYNSNYKCPRCGNIALQFVDSGLSWD